MATPASFSPIIPEYKGDVAPPEKSLPTQKPLPPKRWRQRRPSQRKNPHTPFQQPDPNRPNDIVLTPNLVLKKDIHAWDEEAGKWRWFRKGEIYEGGAPEGQ